MFYIVNSCLFIIIPTDASSITQVMAIDKRVTSLILLSYTIFLSLINIFMWNQNRSEFKNKQIAFHPIEGK